MGTTNKHKATLTLGVVTAGFLISYPFNQSFTGGLLSSGFSAAMIGGLADWFAVAALFHKPLGIPFRTAVIPRNRERIIEAIIDAVEQELLTKENIKETLGTYDISGLLIRYLVDYDGKGRIKEILRRVGSDIIDQQDPDKIGEFAAVIIRSSASEIRMATEAGQLMEWSLRQGLADKLVDFALEEAGYLIRQPQMRVLLAGMLAEARLAYEKGMTRRKFVLQFLEGLGINLDSMAELIQREAVVFLDDLRQPDNIWRQTLRVKALEKANGLINDPVLQARFEKQKNVWLTTNTNLTGFLSELAKILKQASTDEAARIFLHKWIGAKVDYLIADFRQDASRQKVVSGVLREALMAAIDTHHSQIGVMVRERLARYKTDELVEFIETRVGNDLQMIRINGSVVGALAGMALFLLTYWW